MAKFDEMENSNSPNEISIDGIALNFQISSNVQDFQMSSYRNTSIRTDLKGIVDAFRVSELVTICTVAGLSRNGKKTELLSRIYNLIRDPVPQLVEKKIMELFRANNPGQASAMQQRGAGSNMDMNGNRNGGYGAPPTQIPKPPTAPPRPNYGGYNAKPQVAHIAPNNRSGGALNNVGGGQVVGNPGPLKPMEHPDVRFKVIPFYDRIDVIFKPLCLSPHNINSTYQDAYFTFALSQHHLEQIQKSPMVNVYGSGGSVCDRTHQVQVQMRFCMMETSCEQLDCYPPYINVRVNSKSVELPPVLPQSKAGQLPKRSPKPLNITKYIRFDNQINHVQIQWTTEYARSWVCAVFLVKENDSSALLQRLKQKGPRNADHTRALIKDKLKIDPDSEIAMTTLRISLKCPLGVCRMTMPVRSKQCSHVQCFDATFYVRMNEKRPCWQCPVCNKEAPFYDLQLDGYFLEVLDSSTYECTEIFCYDNGSWEPIDGDKTTVQTITGTGSTPVAASKTSNQIIESEPPVKTETRASNNTSGRVTRSTSSNAGSTVETSKKVEEKTTASQVSAGKSTSAKKDSEPPAATPDEEAPENPPEIVDLCSDSDDDDTPNANAPRPVSAISISSTSPGNGAPAGTVVNTNSTSPFPSPPLIQPARQDLSPFNIWGEAVSNNNPNQPSGFIGDTRKRSHEQFASMAEPPRMNLRNEEPLAKNMPSGSSASRAFLNPARSAQSMIHTNRGSMMHPSHNTGGPGYLYPPPPNNSNIISGSSIPLDHHLLGMPPLISPYDSALEGQKRLCAKPKGTEMNLPLNHRDPASTIIPPPPKPPSAMVGSHGVNPHLNNTYFPPPPTRPVESALNIIELE